ncbi:MAG TPA: ferrichrome ABC transporter permease [Deltaproteobacteria bacterium]|nr:ferrichrome ABC transporter permease [Deltaproteobacteria bacterium]
MPTDPTSRRGSAPHGPVALFVLAILSSAFLIFLVQPMVGKRILPWFGGAPGVWTICLAFYQTTLFFGYAYAHLLIRFSPPKAQIWIHALFVGAAFVALPVLPGEVWQPDDVTDPSGDIVAMLAANVALPFMVLASTGPLVQAWFARSHPDRSPYPLYAVSNVGSFAALLAYPFLLEPRLPLSSTGTLWSWAFAATAIGVLACAWIARKAEIGGVPTVPDPRNGSEPLDRIRLALWILLPGCAVILLMGVTNAVCLDVASVPFLWILPLATYLFTFILCFASERYYRPAPHVFLVLVAFALTLGLRVTFAILRLAVDDVVADALESLGESAYVQIPAYCVLLFSSCMILHGELYRLRPPPRALTTFYLCISGGGALGGLFVGIVAPALFDDYYEVRLGLGLTLILFLAAHAHRAIRPQGPGLVGWRWRIGAPLALALGLLALWPYDLDRDRIVYQERSFFGVLRVTEYGKGPRHQRHLVSGSTLHGVEFVESEGVPIPTSYYGRATGIAGTLAWRPKEKPARIGLIGLGVGTLSAYGRPGDTFRYYEIDPAVAHIARDAGYFSFLEKSPADVEVVLGDARLALADEQARSGSQGFDYLILDAFSSDAIPVHLLTLEAFRIYARSLRPGGLIAVHVSNRHFDLLPLVARMGLEIGLSPLVIRTADAPRFQSRDSHWIVLAPDSERVDRLARFLRRRIRAMKLPPDHMRLEPLGNADVEDVPIWTDDYSDLLSVLRIR